MFVIFFAKDFKVFCMIAEEPKFMSSPFFVMEFGNWHLLPGAPKDIVKEFEEFMANDDEYINSTTVNFCEKNRVVKLYDAVLLKDGRTATVIEIFDDTDCLFDISLPDGQYEQKFGTFDQIEKIVK